MTDKQLPEDMLLTLKDLLDYHRQKYPHMYKGNDTYWCKNQQDNMTATFNDFFTVLNREAQLAKAGPIIEKQERERIFNVLNDRYLYILTRDCNSPSEEDWQALKGGK